MMTPCLFCAGQCIFCFERRCSDCRNCKSGSLGLAKKSLEEANEGAKGALHFSGCSEEDRDRSVLIEVGESGFSLTDGVFDFDRFCELDAVELGGGHRCSRHFKIFRVVSSLSDWSKFLVVFAGEVANGDSGDGAEAVVV
ncbi:Hypothetical predicted protein [Olea europaea subsp. europaea]|uniref:Uncharacterized protein n=1 Tax=Olea europaea subsp. europaea TaxID=158383 RepID=A0A8S0TQX1_OLEEU|nr:Hypothetical predicted protein [Olea europaea subsp. europaea]